MERVDRAASHKDGPSLPFSRDVVLGRTKVLNEANAIRATREARRSATPTIEMAATLFDCGAA